MPQLRSFRRFAPIWVIAGAFSAALAAPTDSRAQQIGADLSYADLADIALGAPLAAHVRIKRATALKPERAPGVAPGSTRFYVQADVVSLIRGANGLPAEVSYLADVPNDARGRPAKLARKAEYLITGQTVPGRPGEIRLSAPDAQIPYTAALADRLRAVLREAAAGDAPPAIAAIGRAFHVPGSLPGESETQIFLQTADERPVSLSILRRPNQAPRWAVALSEIVDDTAAAPRPDTLLWYRLACTLPPSLPASSLAEAEPGTSQAIRADYAFVLESLGPCARTRQAR